MIYAGADDSGNRIPNRVQQISELDNLDLPGLSDLLDEPIVSINPAASVRQVQSDLNNAMMRWKADRGLSDSRPQASKYSDYLAVWDAREGFVGGLYVRSEESPLREIASAQKKSTSTVMNQYRSAFKLITGHEYSIENWLTIFGLFKYSRDLGEPGVATAGRPLNSRAAARDVPESVVSSSDELQGLGTRTSDVSEWREIVADINLRIDDGQSDEQIATEMRLKYPVIVSEIRQRGSDGLL